MSHWLEDKYAQMAYSYVPVGSSGALYEALADPVKNKLFFAGEVGSETFQRHHYIEFHHCTFKKLGLK